ncbi:hypothetical protein J4461_01410 [Candidatus Pacearchaeota archaeon]|nr:hypothetical protein [Candidatus Pacearchaeota archaeon]
MNTRLPGSYFESNLHKRKFEARRVIDPKFSDDTTPPEVYSVSPEYFALKGALDNLEENYKPNCLIRQNESGWGGHDKVMSFLICGGIVNVTDNWKNSWKEKPMMYNSSFSELSLELIHQTLEGITELELKLLHPFRQDKREVITI